MANKINIVITAEDKATKPLRAVSDEMDKGSDSSGKFKGALSALGTAITATAVIAGGLLVTGIGASVKASFDQVNAVQQATVALGAYEKNADLVSGALTGLVKYARSDMGVLFQRADLFAAAQGLKVMGDSTDQLTEHVKIMSRSVGLGLSDWADLTQIVGRIGSTSRLTGEDFDNLTKAGFRLDPSLRNTNISFDALFKAMDKGIPADAMAGQADSIQGKFVKMESAFRDVGAAILGVDKDTSKFIEGGIGSRFVAGVEGATSVLKNMEPVARDVTKNVLGLFDTTKATIDLLATGDFKKGFFAAGIQEDSEVIGVLLAIRSAFIKAWDFIKPAIDEFVKVIKTNLVPAFTDLWKEVGPTYLEGLKDLAIILGITVVGSLWLLAKVLTIVTAGVSAYVKAVTAGVNFTRDIFVSVATAVIKAWNSVVRFFESMPDFFRGLWEGLVSGTENAVKAIGAWFADLPNQIAFSLGVVVGWLTSFVTVDIPNFVNSTIAWFNSLPGMVALALANMYLIARDYFLRTAQDAMTATSGLVNGVVSWFQALPGRVLDAANRLWTTVSGAFESFKSSVITWANDAVNGIVSVFTGLPGRIGNSVSGAISGAQNDVGKFFEGLSNNFNKGFGAGAKRAVGTNYDAGGMRLVGEHGPEVVNLPRGSQVTQAYRTRSEGMSSGGINVNIAQLINNNGSGDMNRMWRDMGFALELAS